MSEKEAIQKSIEHWKRMIAWAETQPQENKIWYCEMVTKIGEMPNTEHCALCREYKQGFRLCGTCPLYRKYGACWDEECENLYYKCTSIHTCGEFVEYGKLFLVQLESLLQEAEE